MWRLITVALLAVGEVQAQDTGNGTAECPNVPGFFYQDSCKLLCRETKWTDVVVFYLGNYIAHAATITTRPGQSTLITVVTMIGAVLLPGTGIWNGMSGLLSSDIHGLCELPEGYHLMQVPRKATFAGEDDLPVDHRPCYNLVRVLASIIQLIFAVSTLYRTRGDQIERYGYAAFGLTVIPMTRSTLSAPEHYAIYNTLAKKEVGIRRRKTKPSGESTAL
ncbi:hypothetical protein N0V92_006789 [Colletotrichum tropicale]|nr:hypothetical protein N0V92_006789 [Colletotrichum tropicale]